MDDELKAIWTGMLGRVRGTDDLSEAFEARWNSNLVGGAPTGLPSSASIADLHGWAVALEAYLASLAEPCEQGDLLADAIYQAAHRYRGAYGEAWLGDILALRRLPVASGNAAGQRLWCRSSIDIADLILGQIALISEELPYPDPAAYSFFRRRYEMTANALVSEVIDGQGGRAATLEHVAGTRLLPPDARTVFRDMARLASARRSAGAAHRESAAHQDAVTALWATQIGCLVDSLAALNEGLEELGASDLEEDSALELHLLAEYRQAWARQFDHAFRLLLAADSRERSGYDLTRNLALLKALRKLSAGSPEVIFEAAPPALDLALIQGILWEGYDPAPPIGFGPDGALVIDPAFDARLPELEAADAQPAEGSIA